MASQDEKPGIEETLRRLETLVHVRTTRWLSPEEESEYSALVGYEAKYLAERDDPPGES